MAVINFLTNRSCLDEAVTALRSQGHVGAIDAQPPAATNVVNEPFQTMVIDRLESLEASRDDADEEIREIKVKLSSVQEQLDEIRALSKRVVEMTERMGARLDTMDGRVDAMDDRFDAMHARLDAMDARFDAMDARFDAMDDRFDAMDARLDAMDDRFDAIDARFDAIDVRFNGMGARFDAVEAKLDALIAFVGGGIVMPTPTISAAVLAGGVAVRSVLMKSAEYVVGWWKGVTRLAGHLAVWLSN